MNYRKFYQERTGKKIPKDFHVHHIDFDRNNNNIENLVALPKYTHTGYHTTLNEMRKTDGLVFSKIKPSDNPLFFDFNLQLIQQHSSYFSDVCLWVGFRNNLLNGINDCYVYLNIYY